MYKAKCNISCGNKYYVAGEVYSKKEIEGLDVNDFENVETLEELEEKVKVLVESVTVTEKKPAKKVKAK